jgi:hypothetical protein
VKFFRLFCEKTGTDHSIGVFIRDKQLFFVSEDLDLVSTMKLSDLELTESLEEYADQMPWLKKAGLKVKGE